MGQRMCDEAIRAFLISNYIQHMLKLHAGHQYASIRDAAQAQLIGEFGDFAKRQTDQKLAGWLDQRKGLSVEISQLPRERFRWVDYRASELVTPLWVKDLPHIVTHGTVADVVDFARDPNNGSIAPIFFEKVYRMKRLPSLLELPSLVVSPPAAERSQRNHTMCG